MKKVLCGLTVFVLLMSTLTLAFYIPVNRASAPATQGQTANEKQAELAASEQDGPDYLQPPTYYKTLQTMLSKDRLEQKDSVPRSDVLSGTRPLLVILISLSGAAPDASHTTAYYDSRFFNATPPSVHNYYLEVSYGLFTFVKSAVLGWYPTNYTQTQWVSDPRPTVIEAVGDADSSIDFSIYDTNNDNIVTNSELTLFIIVSGSQGGAFHWSTTNPIATSDGVTVEGEFSATYEGRHIGSYCHELGHDLGLPDLYDTSSIPDSEGIGNYGLMGGGSWTFAHMSAWSKIQLGWITPTFVKASGYYDVHDAETNPEAYILADPSRPSEYFLIENRRPVNSYYEVVGPPVAPGGIFPDEGIVIYHIDETKALDWIRYGINNVNIDEAHKGVDVECADRPTSHVINADHLDSMTNRGDSNDLWDVGTYDFNDNSVPCNAKWYSGAASGFAIGQFPAASQTMRIYFSTPELSPDTAYLFARGYNDLVYYCSYDSKTDSWSSFNDVPSGSTSDTPASTIAGDQLHFVVRGGGDTLWHRYLNLSTHTFSDWIALEGTSPSAPTLSSNGTHLALIVRGGNSLIYYKIYNLATKSWSNWATTPTGSTSESVAAELVGNELHIVVRGVSSESLWYCYCNLASLSWSSWTLIEGSSPSAPTLTSNSTHLCTVVRGSNNLIYYRLQNIASHNWVIPWTAVPSGTSNDRPAATFAGDKLQVVVRGSIGGVLWHSSVDVDTSASSGWRALAGSTPSPPTLTS